MDPSVWSSEVWYLRNSDSLYTSRVMSQIFRPVGLHAASPLQPVLDSVDWLEAASEVLVAVLPDAEACVEDDGCMMGGAA